MELYFKIIIKKNVNNSPLYALRNNSSNDSHLILGKEQKLQIEEHKNTTSISNYLNCDTTRNAVQGLLPVIAAE